MVEFELEDEWDTIEQKDVADRMRWYGGAFFTRLGNALIWADTANAKKIKEAWPEKWEYYKTAPHPSETHRK